jgi:hypothetical protein
MQRTEEQSRRCILLVIVVVVIVIGACQWSYDGEWRLDVHCVQLAALQLSIKVSLLHVRSGKKRRATAVLCRGQWPIA